MHFWWVFNKIDFIPNNFLAEKVQTTADNFPEGIQYLSEVVCCFDKSFNPVPCPRQSFECKSNDQIVLPAIEFDASKRKLGRKPSGKLRNRALTSFEYKISIEPSQVT